MALFVLRKLVLQMRMRSHPLGLMSDVWLNPLSTSILHVCEQRRLWWGCANAQASLSLRWLPICLSTIISWAVSFIKYTNLFEDIIKLLLHGWPNFLFQSGKFISPMFISLFDRPELCNKTKMYCTSNKISHSFKKIQCHLPLTGQPSAQNFWSKSHLDQKPGIIFHCPLNLKKWDKFCSFYGYFYDFPLIFESKTMQILLAIGFYDVMLSTFGTEFLCSPEKYLWKKWSTYIYICTAVLKQIVNPKYKYTFPISTGA